MIVNKNGLSVEIVQLRKEGVHIIQEDNIIYFQLKHIKEIIKILQNINKLNEVKK